MANPIGQMLAVVGRAGEIHTSAKNPIGSQYVDENGNEYIYLVGFAANADGVWCSFNASTYQGVILTADAVGRVAVSTAAVLAANWGWFQIKGFKAVTSSDTVSAAGGLFIDGTPGRVDDASVAGDFVNGAVSTAADTANVLPVQLNYPYVTNTVPA